VKEQMLAITVATATQMVKLMETMSGIVLVSYLHLLQAQALFFFLRKLVFIS